MAFLFKIETHHCVCMSSSPLPPGLQELLDKCRAFGVDIERQLQEEHSSGHASSPSEEFFLRPLNGAAMSPPLELHPHQIDGIRWLMALFKNAVNGILADDMGLGKTVQVIAFLSALYGQRYFGTHLIVVPLSTLDNWKRELERWCPWLPVIVFHGAKEQRGNLREWLRARYKKSWKAHATIAKRSASGEPVESLVKDVGCVVLSTYQMVMSDHAALCRVVPWDVLVVDEAHRLKNFDCKLLNALRKCQAEGRLLLTGTPLQNNVKELWSMLNFIVPEIFSDVYAFQKWFDQAEQVAAAGDQSTDAGTEAAQGGVVVGAKTEDDAAEKTEDVIASTRQHAAPVEVLSSPSEVAMQSLRAAMRRASTTSSSTSGVTTAPLPTLRSYFQDGPSHPHPGGSTASSTLPPSAVPERPPTVAEVSVAVQRMHAALRPFILRRTKSAITSLKLPPKREIVIYTPLFPEQERLYNIIKTSESFSNNRMMHLRKLCCHPRLFPPHAFGDASSHAKGCSSSPAHQRLEDLLSASSKFRMLDKMLRQLLSPAIADERASAASSSKVAPRKHKVLIFSQMTRVLDLIEDYFEILREIASVPPAVRHRKEKPTAPFVVPYVRLDGTSTLEERVASIDHFNLGVKRSRSENDGGGHLNSYNVDDNDGISADNSVFVEPMAAKPNEEQRVGRDRKPLPESSSHHHLAAGTGEEDVDEEEPCVFLISTRSGGVGLNLVAADTVILFDCDFNPHNDEQAIDRCHRIGQTRPVVVYRMVSPSTIEEALMCVALRKKRMEKVVIECGRFQSSIQTTTTTTTESQGASISNSAGTIPRMPPPLAESQPWNDKKGTTPHGTSSGLSRYLFDASNAELSFHYAEISQPQRSVGAGGSASTYNEDDDHMLLQALTMRMTFGHNPLSLGSGGGGGGESAGGGQLSDADLVNLMQREYVLALE